MKNCKECVQPITTGDKRKEFCCKSCAATYNNKRRKKKKKEKTRCLNCSDVCSRSTNKYCGNKCQREYQRKEIFKKIENGDTQQEHRQYKNYLIFKYGEKCMECDWCEKNIYSGKIPIELEHIDGNSNNNELKNLKLLCPNHHALTATYKSLNQGNGRHSRRQRYKEGKSY
jgi:hypothetical protein